MKTSRALIAGLAVMTLVVIGLTITLAVVLLGGEDEGQDNGEKADKPSRLQTAVKTCDAVDDQNTLTLADDASSIIVDTVNEYGSPAGIGCVLEELGTSEALVAQMDATTAMMGSQSAEEDGLSYRWSYHPDNGVNMTITEQ